MRLGVAQRSGNPGISLVFREMWDSTSLVRSAFKDEATPKLENSALESHISRKRTRCGGTFLRELQASHRHERAAENTGTKGTALAVPQYAASMRALHVAGKLNSLEGDGLQAVRK
jgi:hypothetical protein